MRDEEIPNSEDFDPSFYRRIYEDLEGLSDRQLTRHWRNGGRAEGRFGCALQLRQTASSLGLDAEAFSPVDYLALNHDLPESLLAADRALHHYVTTGIFEQRQICVAQILSTAGDARTDDYLLALLAPLTPSALDENLVLLHELAKNCLPELSQIEEWVGDIGAGATDLKSLFMRWVRERLVAENHAIAGSASDFHMRDLHEGCDSDTLLADAFETVPVLGSRVPIVVEEWLARLDKVTGRQAHSEPRLEPGKLSSSVPATSEPRLAVLISLYRPDIHLKVFLENLREQEDADKCEFAFVLVEPSEFVQKVVTEFAEEFPNSVILTSRSRISIYDAWNAAIHATSAPLITNANVDDLRRSDSFRRQIALLESRPDADVGYQDYFISLRPHLEWRILEDLGVRTKLPPVTPKSLLDVNSPHAAPVWRRILHQQVGLFNGSLESAGDHDFWLRCALSGASFVKDTDVHVAYFVNPIGMSTRPDSPGTTESRRLRMRYWWLFRRAGLL